MPLRFSKIAWFALRAHTVFHIRILAIALAFIATGAKALESGSALQALWFTAGAAAVLYCAHVLLALCGMLFSLLPEMRRKSQHLCAGGSVIGLAQTTGSGLAVSSLCVTVIEALAIRGGDNLLLPVAAVLLAPAFTRASLAFAATAGVMLLILMAWCSRRATA